MRPPNVSLRRAKGRSARTMKSVQYCGSPPYRDGEGTGAAMRPGFRAAEAKGNPHMKVAPRSSRAQSVSSGAGAAWSIYSRGTPDVLATQSNNVRHASRTPGVTAYIRALAIRDIVQA